MTKRIESLIDYLAREGYNFEYDPDYKTLNVFFKKGYISMGVNATKKLFRELFDAYMTNNRTVPGIVWNN